MAAIGVHFGYTCACVAVFKDGRADVVANDAGDRVTPAVVAYRDTEQIVGIAAKQGRIRNATNTVVKVKQILGRCYDDPDAQTHREESKCIVVNKSDLLRYEIDTGETTKYVSPEDVAKLIFHKMKETAQSALGSDVKDAVITVPFEFGEMQKNALRQAAESAGFNVLRLIHEPTAALLAYGIGQDSLLGKSHVLVYKLGGTSLSVTILEVNSGMYRVLATQTDHRTGGESFTHELSQHLAAEFKKSVDVLRLFAVAKQLHTFQNLKSFIVLRDLEPKEELHDIVTVLTMKRDGSLHVTCTEQSSGRSEAITIETAAAAS
uniref:Heat shock 70 kDa protein 14-like n=1 Tax=Sinocyclocheilus rhinocerous TaxID=307959 RepID=A0A673JJR7_9TELE